MLGSMDAWNGWYHVNGNTYGTWLPGDPRGWRAKGHKTHVEGDYKSPPPEGTGDALHQHAGDLLKQAPVHLTAAQRETGSQALAEMLLHQQIEIIALSLDAIHFHLLARFRNKQVRPIVGRAKRHVTYVLRERGHVGKVWSGNGKVTPVSDRQHQVNVFNYITRHADHGAWLWTFHKGIYWPSTIQTPET